MAIAIPCPRCGRTLEPHCKHTTRRTPCGWLACFNRACRFRWVNQSGRVVDDTEQARG